MRPQSAKAKGRAAQQLVRDKILASFADLTPNDVRSTSMGASGVDILLSEAALAEFPFAVEVKCQESMNIWAALEQAEENATEDVMPLLCFKRNRTEMYVALKLDDLFNLIRRMKYPE